MKNRPQAPERGQRATPAFLAYELLRDARQGQIPQVDGTSAAYLFKHACQQEGLEEKVNRVLGPMREIDDLLADREATSLTQDALREWGDPEAKSD